MKDIYALGLSACLLVGGCVDKTQNCDQTAGTLASGTFKLPYAAIGISDINIKRFQGEIPIDGKEYEVFLQKTEIIDKEYNVSSKNCEIKFLKGFYLEGNPVKVYFNDGGCDETWEMVSYDIAGEATDFSREYLKEIKDDSRDLALDLSDKLVKQAERQGSPRGAKSSNKIRDLVTILAHK